MFAFKDLPKIVYQMFCQFLVLLHQHAHIHLYAFDPIHDVPEAVQLNELAEYRRARVRQEASTIHYYFLLQLAVWLFLFIDTVWLTVQHADKVSYRANPYVYTHRMYPPSFWAKGDMLVLAVSAGILLFGLTFLFRKWLDDRYCMYVLRDTSGRRVLIVNGKAWNRHNAAKILEFRKRIRAVAPIMAILSVIVCDLFFGWSMWNAPFNDLAYHFKMWLYLPLLTWYLIFTAVLIMLHFYVLTQYVIYKQSHLLARQSTLLKRIRVSKNRPQAITLPRLYRHFHRLQSNFAYQCAEIAGYNIFWRVPLTVLFAVEIETFCYLLYSCLFDQLPIDAFIYFFFFLIEMGAFFFVVILRASVVDHHNDRAYERNVQTAVLFQLANLPIDNQMLLNIEKLATNRNFSRCCFRLANGYRVDSTAFQMALYIVSTFFLMICRSNRRNGEM